MNKRTQTDKGERTREKILECALQLMVERGYAGTTMREIAAAAGCSLGLAYHYFASKEALVLVLYERLAEQLEQDLAQLPPGPLAQRFAAAIRANIALLTPYRGALAALFSVAVDPASQVAVLGPGSALVRRRIHAIFARVVAGAEDAPTGMQAEQLTTLLFGIHMSFVFFWLQDRTAGARATLELLELVSTAMALLGPLLLLPEGAMALERASQVIGPVLGATLSLD